MIYELDLAARCMLVAVIYGWTGAEKNNEASERTDDLCTVMLEELEQHAKGPVLVMGDLNGEPECFPTIGRMAHELGWCDLGARAEFWGGVAEQWTCRANGISKATRRDFMFANEYLLPAISKFRVNYSDEFPTHQPLQVMIATKRLEVEHRLVMKPASAADKVEEHMVQRTCGMEAKEAREMRKKEMQRLHWR